MTEGALPVYSELFLQWCEDDEADGRVVFLQEVSRLREFLGVGKTVGVGVGGGIEGMAGGLLVEGFFPVGEAVGVDVSGIESDAEAVEAVRRRIGESQALSIGGHHTGGDGLPDLQVGAGFELVCAVGKDGPGENEVRAGERRERSNDEGTGIGGNGAPEHLVKVAHAVAVSVGVGRGGAAEEDGFVNIRQA